jgi:Uma2 family endonuclease
MATMNAPSRAPARFTEAEFERLVRSGAFRGARVELRRGMIVKMNAQFVPHGRVKRLLARALEPALGRCGFDWIVDQEISVSFGGGFEPMPDVTVWDPAGLPEVIDGPIPAASVKLVVEVSDASSPDDCRDKLEDYASADLKEYWVADVKRRVILQHTEPRPGEYARRDVRAFGDRFALITQPDVIVDTSALLYSR